MDEQIKAMMDEAFRFKIGEIVALRKDVERVNGEVEINGPNKVDRYSLGNMRTGVVPGSVVVERLIQQCHGGVQRHYRVAGSDTDGKRALGDFTEFELVAWADAIEVCRKLKPIPKED